MSTKYNAFISYCHGDPDSAVAKDVQRQLEHFHIPAAIRKLTGRKKIERIFRDKDELPISYDLGSDITEALENSEFLIVICSERTSASHWVMREIETFLQTHDINHVLTVTVRGEPADVIPDILTSRNVTETAPDGTTYTGTELLEPLSCDYRIGFRKARKEEIPRLAAAMLGCTYDQLVQRSRQYRHRVTALALSGVSLVSLAFGLYAVRTGLKIQSNYNQALLSQSQFLASESTSLLNDGDRMAAITLALEALPQEGKDRPYLAEAERALSSAVGTYSFAQNNALNMRPTASFQFENSLTTFLVSTPEKYLICKDTSDVIWVQSIENNEVLGIIPAWKAADVEESAQKAVKTENTDDDASGGGDTASDDDGSGSGDAASADDGSDSRDAANADDGSDSRDAANADNGTSDSRDAANADNGTSGSGDAANESSSDANDAAVNGTADSSDDRAGITRADYSVSDPDLLGTIGDEAVILYNAQTLWCYSLPDCEVIWRQDLVSSDEYAWIYHAALNPSCTEIAAMTKENVYILDAKSGKVLKKKAFPEFEQDYGFLSDTVPNGVFSNYMSFSSDEQYAVFSLFCNTKEEYGAFIDRTYLPAVLNMETGDVTYYPHKGYDTYRAGITHSGNLLLIGAEIGSEQSQYAFGGYMMQESKMHIHCVDPETSKILWHTEFSTTQLSPDTEFFPVIFTDDEGKDHAATILIASNRTIILDDETGNILAQEETPGAILDAEFTQSGKIRTITSEGYYTSSNSSGHGYMAVQNMPRYLVKAVLRSDNAWLLARRNNSSLSSKILQYSFNNSDANWEVLPEPVDYITPDGAYVCDDAFALLDTEDLLCSVNLNGRYVSRSQDDNSSSQKNRNTGGSKGSSQKDRDADGSGDAGAGSNMDFADIMRIPLGEYNSRDLCILGFSPGGEYVLLKNDSYSETGLLLADRQTGEMRAQDVQINEDTYPNFQIIDVDYAEGTLYYLWSATDPQDPWTTQIRFGMLPAEDLGTDAENDFWDNSGLIKEIGFSSPSGDVCIDPTGRFALIHVRDYDEKFDPVERFFFLNIRENTISECPDIAKDLPEYFSRDFKYYAFWEDTLASPKTTPRLAFTGTSAVRLFDCEGRLLKTLKSGSSAPLAAHFHGSDDLIVLFANGFLRKFNIDQGKMTETLDLTGSSLSASEQIKFEYIDNQTLLLYIDTDALLVYLPQWQELSSVPACLGYIPCGNRFLCRDSSELGYRVRYTTKTLIEKARETLGSYTLSEAQKHDYGL